MRSTRLAAAGIAAGAMVLGMAGPALATPNDKPVKPGSFCAEDAIGQKAETVTGKVAVCTKGEDGKARWVVPGDDQPGTPTPTPTKPTFKFGYDKVKLSTTRVAPGQKTTFAVTCPSTVTITGNGYTQNPLPVKKTGENTWGATGTFKSSLPDPTNVTVVCKGFGSVKYSTSPAKDDGNGNGNGGGNNMTPKTPKVPTGPINTGDGSTLNNGGSPMAAAAWGAIAFLGLGAVALRRRTAQERS